MHLLSMKASRRHKIDCVIKWLLERSEKMWNLKKTHGVKHVKVKSETQNFVEPNLGLH